MPYVGLAFNSGIDGKFHSFFVAKKQNCSLTSGHILYHPLLQALVTSGGGTATQVDDDDDDEDLSRLCEFLVQFQLLTPCLPVSPSFVPFLSSCLSGYFCSFALAVCVRVVLAQQNYNLQQLNECCRSCQGCVLLLVLKQHLKKCYGLTDK